MNDYVMNTEDAMFKSVGQTVTTAAALIGFLGAPGSAIAAQQQGCRVSPLASQSAVVRSVSRTEKRVHLKEAPNVAAGDALKKIRQSFGFNVTELAELFSVSRPTVYSWLKGGEVKRDVSLKMQVLDAVAPYWAKLQGGENLSFLLDYKGAEANDISIREAMRAAILNTNALRSLIDTRLAEYNKAATLSREIIGEVELVQAEVPESAKRLNELWSKNIKKLKGAQHKDI